MATQINGWSVLLWGGKSVSLGFLPRAGKADAGAQRARGQVRAQTGRLPFTWLPWAARQRRLTGAREGTDA